jgi:hypothetical protein
MKTVSPLAKPKARGPVPRLGRRGEPHLADFRRSLVGRPHEALVVGAFAMLVGISFMYMVRWERLVAPDRAYMADGGAAIVALKDEAHSRLQALAGFAGQMGVTEPTRVAAAFGIGGAASAPAAARAATAVRVAALRHPVSHGRFVRARRRARAMVAGHGISVAAATRLRHTAPALSGPLYSGSLYDGSTMSRMSHWMLYEFPDRLADECGKAYYGILSFVANGIDFGEHPQITADMQSWIDWLTNLLGIPGFDGGLEGASAVSTVLVFAGMALIGTLVVGCALSTRDALQDTARRARRRRLSEIA